jgi:hypothetical protein
VTVNGVLQINQGGFPGGTGTYSYNASTGSLVFNNSTSSYGVNNDNYWPTTNGPVNVNVLGAGGITMNVARTVNSTFQTSAQVVNGGNLTLNGITQINAGGSFSASSPTYGSSSTLIYNPGGSYNTSYEWSTGGSVGTGVPRNVTVQNGTNLSVSNAHTVPGALLVTNGSTIAFNNALTVNGGATINGTAQVNNGGYFANAPTYGSASTLIYNTGNPYGMYNEWPSANSPHHVIIQNNTNVTWSSGARTVPGNFTITSGSLTLGGSNGDDLYVGGNWTNSGTFTPNNRAVFFNGTAAQQLTGATTFDYLTLDNASGLTLNSNITVNQTLDLANGDINASGNVLALGSGASVTGSGDIVGLARRSNLAANTTYTFSNARTQLTFSSPLSIPQMDVTLLKLVPPNFTFALPRLYTLSEPAGPFSATVQLAYKVAEIPITTTESNIRLWRYNPGTNSWQNRGGTLLTFASPWHAVSQFGITEFSNWVLSGLGPTAVDLTMLEVRPQSSDLWLVAGLLLGVGLLVVGWGLKRRRA